ncbi:MAG: hypothetical protein IT391_06665 [Nitrospira sp.]|nr:hypothetical protein [Nitrospira sp.]
MKRLHPGGPAIEAAQVADEGAGQERRDIDALQLIVQPTNGAVNVSEKWLYLDGGARNCRFQPQELLPK